MSVIKKILEGELIRQADLIKKRKVPESKQYIEGNSF